MEKTKYFGAIRSTGELAIKEAREERYGKAYQDRTPEYPIVRDHQFYHTCLEEHGKDATITKWARIGIIGGLAHCFCALEFGILSTVVTNYSGKSSHIRVCRKGGGAMQRKYK